MKFNKHLANLQCYEAGKPIELVVSKFGIEANEVIKLASNENPFGTSPVVKLALAEMMDKLHLYPDDSYFQLKDTLAANFEVGTKNIIIGAGSDQIIEFCIHAKANKKNAILTAGTTFAMYEIYAKHVGANVIKTKSPTHDLSEFKKLYKQNAHKISVIFLCVPNNPLGDCLDAREVYNFISEVGKNTLVVIDAAYNDYAKFKDPKKGIDPRYICKNFKNAIYLGTFSKSYGLGGMRIGYGIAKRSIINELGKLRAPFNITNLSLKAATMALFDKEFVKAGIQNNFEQMLRYEEFAKTHGIEFLPSYTNFIVFKFDKQNASQIANKLLQQGIILRDMKSYGLNALRITIGTPEQNDKVFEKLDEILK
ncbi:MAG: histidinol-phosphate transaminase [Campylobacter sp.]|nr:histidinol-phosphate transaminase [Campylobacter sp.]